MNPTTLLLLAGAGLGAIALLTRGSSKVPVHPGQPTTPSVPGATPAQPPTCTPMVKEGSRVVLVGDSLSVGLKRKIGPWVREAGGEFKSFTRGGTAMFQWLRGAKISGFNEKRAAFWRTVENWKPTLVLICLGTNDSHPWSKGHDGILWKRIPEYVDDMVRRCSEYGAEVLWILPPKEQMGTGKKVCTADKSKCWNNPVFDDIVGPVVKEKGIPYFDSPNAVDIKMGGDNIHPTGTGYQQWSDAMRRQMTCKE